MKIGAQLKIFLNESHSFPASVRWLRDKKMQVYVRYNQRSIDGDRVITFEIANVDVAQLHRGQGIFKEFLAFVIHMLKTTGKPCGAIYVENVSERFSSFFEKNKWTRDLSHEDRCYYRECRIRTIGTRDTTKKEGYLWTTGILRLGRFCPLLSLKHWWQSMVSRLARRNQRTRKAAGLALR